MALDADRAKNAVALMKEICSCYPMGSRMQACREIVAYTERTFDFRVLATVVDDADVWKDLCSCRDALYVVCVAALQLHERPQGVPDACRHVTEVLVKQRVHPDMHPWSLDQPRLHVETSAEMPVNADSDHAAQLTRMVYAWQYLLGCSRERQCRDICRMLWRSEATPSVPRMVGVMMHRADSQAWVEMSRSIQYQQYLVAAKLAVASNSLQGHFRRDGHGTLSAFQGFLDTYSGFASASPELIPPRAHLAIQSLNQ